MLGAGYSPIPAIPAGAPVASPRLLMGYSTPGKAREDLNQQRQERSEGSLGEGALGETAVCSLCLTQREDHGCMSLESTKAPNKAHGKSRWTQEEGNSSCVPKDSQASTDPPNCVREAGLTWSKAIKHSCIQGCGSQAAMTLKAKACKPTSNHPSTVHHLGKLVSLGAAPPSTRSFHWESPGETASLVPRVEQRQLAALNSKLRITPSPQQGERAHPHTHPFSLCGQNHTSTCAALRRHL